MKSPLERILAHWSYKLTQPQAMVVGPFTIYWHPTEKKSVGSCAIPHIISANKEWTTAVAELVKTFHERSYRPHVQFLAELAPQLPEALEKAGFQQKNKFDLLYCTPESYRPVPIMPQLSIQDISYNSALEDVKDSLNVNEMGFDPETDYQATNEQAIGFRQLLVTGRAFVLRFKGRPVSAGMFTEIRDETTELSGIATLPEFRRRGFAAYLTAHMAKTAFNYNVKTVYMNPVDPAADRIYRRVGFDRAGHWVSYVLD